jgi:hypothetical protein
MGSFSNRSSQFSRGLVALLFIVACSRTEQQTVTATAPVAAQKAEVAPASSAASGAQAAPSAPPEVTPDTPEEGLPGFDEALARRRDAPLVRPVAEVTVDGKAWDTSAGVTVRGSDLWIGFVVEVVSAGGDRLTIQVPRGASQGQRITGEDIEVAYVRGNETWLEHGSGTAAEVTRWQDDGPRPVVSLDCTARLRREQRPGKIMRVEARVANVPIADEPREPALGLEKKAH